MELKIKIIFLSLFLNVLFLNMGLAQTVPQGVTYQGIARNSSGSIIVDQAISVKLGIYAPTVNGTLEWEETHTITTNQLGLFYFIIGQGASTSAGTVSSFALINWGAANHFVKIALDENGGSSYVSIDTIQFWSVPYAMYSGASASVNQSLHQLLDVDTIVVTVGDVLKWNGSLWVPSVDNSDTVSYVANSNHSNTSDTADYAVNVLSTVDTILYSTSSGTAAFAVNAATSTNSTNSNYCDTAIYALNSASSFLYWNLTGNTGTNAASNFIGTTDNVDFVLKTNSAERMRITSGGKIGIGTNAPTASVHIIGNDGLLAEGTFGSGALAPNGAGTRMLWYPKKAAFRAGNVTSSQWNDGNVGNYSFAGCYNNIASGDYSTSFGQNNTSSGNNSVAIGVGNVASASGSVALGSINNALGAYSVAMARGCSANDSGSVCIGYHSTVNGKFAVAFGAYTSASGDYSTVMGYYASSGGKKGSFVYADQSSTSVTKSTVDNQFVVRASGGVNLFSNTALSSGVSLAAGAGSWASVSDKHKKENFKREDADAVLNKLSQLSVTSWNYKTQASSIRHIGPMAQDFYKAFNFGESDTTITTIDMDGVSLLAIQALIKKTNELKRKADEVERLKMLVGKLENEKQQLEKRISGIEQKLNLSAIPSTASSK